MSKSPSSGIIGFFGGTFNPVHFGHLKLAETLMNQEGLEEVWFCPAYMNPFKLGKESTSSEDRLAMLKLAIKDFPSFKVIDEEAFRPGPSYTIDTLRELIKKTGKSFRLILGSDLVKDFSKWKAAEELKKLAPPLVGERDHISSTDIRTRLSQGLSVENLVPPPVIEYIKKKGLYAERKS